MTDGKELLNEDILSLVSGGRLRYDWQKNLDEMMDRYEDDLTKEEFLKKFAWHWEMAKAGYHIGGAVVRARFTEDLTDEDYAALMQYIEANYVYRGPKYY